MKRTLDEIRLSILSDGRVVMHGCDTHSCEFRQFVQSADKPFLAAMDNHRDRELRSDTRNNLSERMHQARFRVSGRKEKYNFSFGFAGDDQEFNTEGLLRSHYRGDPTLSLGEQIATVLKDHPKYYEEIDEETGQKVFCRPSVDTNKRNWGWDFVNSSIVVYKASKEKTP